MRPVPKTILRAILMGTLLIPPLAGPIALSQPTSIDIVDAPIPIQVLAQSPAETKTDLQMICLFRSSPVNTLHGSLLEVNEKLNGLLERIRKPELFRGEVGETLLLAPQDAMGARKLLIIGPGDSQDFLRGECDWLGKSFMRRQAGSA
jgi:hypothetical protein